MAAATVLVALALDAAAPLGVASGTFSSMQPGFWFKTTVLHMTIAGHPTDTDNTPMVSYGCEDEASMAAAMKAMAGAMDGCPFEIEGSGSTDRMALNCKDPRGVSGTATSSGSITTDGATAIHFTINGSANFSNMPQMMSESTGDRKWLGACPAGVNPGDCGTIQNGTFTKRGNVLTKQ